MTNWTDNSGARRVRCCRCETEFSCNPLGACWCKQETRRLIMPTTGEDCLCRDCLRKAAGGITIA